MPLDVPRMASKLSAALNVWTPAVGAGKRPVLVWCHGGGFATGSGSSPVTDGANLARRGDVVVVSLNHRLNVLGFTHLSELSPELAQSGDVGMLDIRWEGMASLCATLAGLPMWQSKINS